METQRHYCSNDGTRIAYRLRRRDHSDTALVMLHGLASNSSRWSELADTLRLDPPWDLLRLDLRGHGDSLVRGRIGHAVWCEDLHGMLAQADYRRVVLLGHSLGAQLALHYAHGHPHMTAGLILIDPVVPQCLQGTLARVARLRGLLPPLIAILRLLNAAGIKRRHFPTLDLQQLDRRTRELLRHQPDTRIDKIYARPLSDLKYLPTANYLQDLYAVTAPLPPLADLQAPVLVLLSRGVKLTDLSQTQARLARLPNTEFKIIDADHWMLTERPDEARLAIQDWCNRRAVASQ